jgi:lysophospholipase L1-like esterase
VTTTDKTVESSGPTADESSKDRRREQRRLSGLRRVIFAVLALLAFFALTELVLYGVGRVAYHQTVSRFNPQRSVSDGDVFRVVTFGDSVTAGQGTAPQYSYPRQLEDLLNKGKTGGQFEVVNNGVYALNSSRTADLLPGWLEEFQPDLIVVMTGCNNAWNYRNSHLDELGLLGAEERSPLLKLLDNTRTYRFLRVLLKRQKTGFGIAEEQGPSPILRGNMQISKSISPAVDPTAATLERQRTLFKDAGALDKLLEHDLSEITRIAGEFGASIVLMTYPFRPPYQKHGELTLRFAEEQGLMIADNYAIFESVKRSKPGLDLFSADRGHPNATGYRVIAANIYEQMRLHQDRLDISLGPTPDPLKSFKDKDYLLDLYEEVKLSAEVPGADEYVFEALGYVAMELEDAALAEEAFLLAFERSGGAPQFYESLGNLYVRQEKWDDLDDLKVKMLGMRSDRNDISFLLEMFEREAQIGRQGLPTGELGGWNRQGDEQGPGDRKGGLQKLGGGAPEPQGGRGPAPQGLGGPSGPNDNGNVGGGGRSRPISGGDAGVPPG